jgi:alkaline phosphatase D
MVLVDRRTALFTGVAAGAAPGVLSGLVRRDAPAFVRPRLEVPTGVRSGDVTTESAVLWACSSGEGRLMVRLSSIGRRMRSVRGPWADERTDHTARVTLRGLAPGREYDATMWFMSPEGTKGREYHLRFATAPVHPAPTSFVWSADSCGQGWGINPDLGGLTGYRAMLDVHPDLFLHCGDNIYADEPIPETQTEPDGSLWRNEVAFGVDHVAQSLDDFRGRYRYLLLDRNVRRLHEAVPTVAQWDDHETVNNWYPGEHHDDERYTERRCDVLAARGRRAWQEYQPISLDHLTGRGRTGFAEHRIYRKVSRGAHLDVFCLDMRSHRGGNGVPAGSPQRGLLGREQADWLVRSVAQSTATWKVIAADQPLSVLPRLVDDRDGYANHDDGTPAGREAELARVLSGFRAHGVRNVVWVTADVHYAAAHHYAPERASYTDFDPFWEFVAGPIAGSTFPVKDVDRTFGARVVFAKGPDGEADSPRQGNQFFGHVEIARSGAMTVRLCDVRGNVLWSRVLEPEPQR